MNTAVIENNGGSLPGNIRFGILGFAYAVAAYLVPAFFAGSYIGSTEIAKLDAMSVFVQFFVGISLSILAYKCVRNTSLKAGMRVCYGSVIGFLFAVGGYSIMTSLTSL